jgi:nucleoside-triphosphatase
LLQSHQKNVLFTGPPRCGKSTLIEKIVKKIDAPAIGFFTREIRESGQRVGFSINTLDHRTGVLAHQNHRSRFRVGRYGVNLEDIDRIAVPAMMPDRPDMLVVIDEIGKMECLSERFKKTLVSLLDSNHRVLGSITMKGDRFIRRIKERADVFLITVTIENRDKLVNRFIGGPLSSFLFSNSRLSEPDTSHKKRNEDQQQYDR